MPGKGILRSSCTAISSPRNGSFFPTERAEASSAQLADRKLALLQHLDHLDPHGSGGSDDGDAQIPTHKKGAHCKGSDHAQCKFASTFPRKRSTCSMTPASSCAATPPPPRGSALGFEPGSYQDADGALSHRGKNRRRRARTGRFSWGACRPANSARRTIRRIACRRASSGWRGSTRKTRIPASATSTSTARMRESQLGTPASHGCIRLSNADVVDFSSRWKWHGERPVTRSKR